MRSLVRFFRTGIAVIGFFWLGLSLWSSLERVGVSPVFNDIVSLDVLLAVYRQHMSIFYQYFDLMARDTPVSLGNPRFFADILLNIYLLISTTGRYAPKIILRNWGVFIQLLIVVLIYMIMGFFFLRGTPSDDWPTIVFMGVIVPLSLTLTIIAPLYLLQAAFASRKDMLDAVKVVAYVISTLITVYLSSLGIVIWGLDPITAAAAIGVLALMMGFVAALMPAEGSD